MLLAELGPGQKFKVLRVTFGGEIGKRLADLGFISGAEGHVVRAALFHGPMQIRLADYDLIMRRHEAKLVEIELLPQPVPVSEPASEAHTVIDIRPNAIGMRPKGMRHLNRGFHHGRPGCP